MLHAVGRARNVCKLLCSTRFLRGGVQVHLAEFPMRNKQLRFDKPVQPWLQHGQLYQVNFSDGGTAKSLSLPGWHWRRSITLSAATNTYPSWWNAASRSRYTEAHSRRRCIIPARVRTAAVRRRLGRQVILLETAAARRPSQQMRRKCNKLASIYNDKPQQTQKHLSFDLVEIAGIAGNGRPATTGYDPVNGCSRKACICSVYLAANLYMDRQRDSSREVTAGNKRSLQCHCSIVETDLVLTNVESRETVDRMHAVVAHHTKRPCGCHVTAMWAPCEDVKSRQNNQKNCFLFDM